MATTSDHNRLVERLVSQTVTGFELDQVNGMIADGTNVYLAMFEFEHESHAPRIKGVTDWTPDASEVRVVFAEDILPDKRVAVDERVTVLYLRPFNPSA